LYLSFLLLDSHLLDSHLLATEAEQLLLKISDFTKDMD
jgi:hypothetical protein